MTKKYFHKDDIADWSSFNTASTLSCCAEVEDTKKSNLSAGAGLGARNAKRLIWAKSFVRMVERRAPK